MEKIIQFFLVFFSIVSASSTRLLAAAQPPEWAEWAHLASGQHSFKGLPPSFYREYSVRAARNAKLIYFDAEMADRLRLPYPKDPGKLNASARNSLKDNGYVCKRRSCGGGPP